MRYAFNQFTRAGETRRATVVTSRKAEMNQVLRDIGVLGLLCMTSMSVWMSLIYSSTGSGSFLSIRMQVVFALSMECHASRRHCGHPAGSILVRPTSNSSQYISQTLRLFANQNCCDGSILFEATFMLYVAPVIQKQLANYCHEPLVSIQHRHKATQR